MPNRPVWGLLRGRWIMALAVGLLLSALLNAGLGFVALKKLEKKAGAPIRGIFLPHFLQPAFTVKDPKLDWQGRFQVLSGSLRVRYDPLFLVPGWKFRVQVEGRELAVSLGGELAESQGLKDVKVDRFEADFALPGEGDPEIFLFNIESPQIHFRLAKQGKKLIDGR